MGRLGRLTFGGIAVVASTHCGYPTFIFNGGNGGTGAGGAGGSTGTSSSSSSGSSTTAGSGGRETSSSSSSSTSTSSSTSSSSSSSSGQLTCADVHGTYGCCDMDGVLHYCNDGVTVMSEVCPSLTTCGWDSSNDFYDCSYFPGTSSTHPIDCGSP